LANAGTGLRGARFAIFSSFPTAHRPRRDHSEERPPEREDHGQ
jgi:hypothetical protein